jgi:hypothetical protein
MEVVQAKREGQRAVIRSSLIVNHRQSSIIALTSRLLKNSEIL